MAINKRKILQSAQKHMQKGALDKALKDYMSLLKADPSDSNIRLKVGDIHLKQGNTEEAVAAYEKVAQRFMKDGFDAKAVALYKQITKIDPKRVQIYEPLAELYQRLGLTSDAMSALQTAADAHYRAGAKDEALDLLRKMASLDPSNTTSRLKVADLLRQEGRSDEAVSEFHAVAEELARQGDHEERARVLERVLEIDPAHRDTLEGLARTRLEVRDLGRAESAALAFIEKHPDELVAYQLLAEIVEAADKIGSHALHFRKMAEILKARGDDGESRTIMQRFVAAGGFGSDASDQPVLETDDDLAIDTDGAPGELGLEGPAFTDPGFAGDDGLRLGAPIEGLESGEAADEDTGDASAPSLPPLPRLELEEEEDGGGDEEPDDVGQAAADDTDGELDPEQVVAEAGVYLRYGKHERAIEALRRVLAQEPGHRGALMRLGEAFAAAGDTDNAVRSLERAAEQARGEGDTDGLEAIRAQLAAIDPAAAEALGPAPEADREPASGITIDGDGGPEAEGAAAETLASDDGIEFEIDVDDVSDTAEADADEGDEPGTLELAEADAEEPPSESALDAGDDAAAISFDAGSAEADFDLGEAGDEDAGIDLPAAAGAVAAPEVEIADEDLSFDEEGEEAADPGQTVTLESGDGEEAFELDLDVDVEGDAGDAPADVTARADEEASGSSTSSSTTPSQIVEELEEAEFYYQQGMMDEAREIYTRILEAAPHHPQALLRLGEIEAAAEGGAPEAPAPEAAAPEAPSAVEAAPDVEEAADDDALAVPGEGFEDLSFDDDEDDTDADVQGAPASRAQAEVTAPFGRTGEAAAASEDALDAPDAGSAAEAAPAGDAGDFDLAAELSDAFDEEDALGDTGPRAGTTEEEGFEQVFAAFKAGVKKELGDGDSEAHYDLGIAYKEMGLLEDAIGEFATAVASEAHRLPCLHMMALCNLDLGRTQDAVANLEQALSVPSVPEEQQAALRFDLGRAYATAGDVERARAAFEAVQAVDPEFRDVAAQLEALAAGAPLPAAPEEEDEAFESFDDLLAESDAEEVAEAEPAESYESFDDIMDDTEPPAEAAEVEPEAPAEAEAEPVAEPEAPAEPQPEPEPEGSGGKPGRRRRKKISFV